MFSIKKVLVLLFLLSILTGALYAGWQDLPLYDSNGGPLFDYATMLSRTILFYDANRCGNEVTATSRFNWRGDCHINDGIEATLSNGSTVWIDARGGYHDAGDHIKFGITNGYASATLGWGFYEFREEYEETGQDTWLLRAVKWATDYFIRCHPEPETFLYSVGSAEDHNFWGPPELQSDSRSPRDIIIANPSNPASDVLGATAASLALMSINYRHIDADYADLCLQHAKELYSLGRNYLGLSTGLSFYPPSIFWDDLAWGAAWLYRATGDEYYFNEFKVIVGPDGAGLDNDSDIENGIAWDNQWTHCWDAVWAGAFIAIAGETGHPALVEQVEFNLNFWMDSVPETPGGLKYLNEWGSLRYSTAAAFTALAYYNEFPTTENEKYRDFGGKQMSYALGSNPLDRCYIVGVGNNSPQFPHHDAAHGSDTGFLDDPPEHKHVLYGALCGGPGMDDRHNDATDDYVQNEVSIDYNAAVVGALAGMRRFYGPETMPEPDPTPEPPIEACYTEARLEKDIASRSQVTVYIHNHAVHPPRFETELSYRFFVNLTEVFEQGYDLSTVSIETVVNENSLATRTAELIPWDELNNIYYLEVFYSDVLLYNKREFQFGLIFTTPNFLGQWDSSNDFSVEGLSGTVIRTPHIPVYRNGVLIWGETPYKDVTPPGVPAGLIADAIGSSQVNLDWNDNPEDDVASYNIYRGDYSGFTANVSTYVGTSSESRYSDTDLEAVTTYYYRVTAVDTALNEGLASITASATTLIPDTIDPGRPSGLMITALGPDSVDLDWQDNIELDISKYKIYRSDISGFTISVNNLAGESLTSAFSDSGLSAETTYYYKVVAVDTSGNDSISSSEASATTLPPLPPSLRVQYRCTNTGSTSSALRFDVYLFNDGDIDVALTDIAIRYWFTSEPDLSSLGANCDYADSGHSDIEFSFGNAGASQYVDVLFAPTATVPTWLGGSGSSNVLPPGANTGETQCRISVTGGGGQFSQSDDWSFDASKDGPADWDRITVYYRDSVLCWGAPPSAASDSSFPVLSGPSDLSVSAGSTGNSIGWIAVDENPGSYSITRNNAQAASGSWYSGSLITVSADGLSAGTYTYTISVSDAGGNTTTDSVRVTVTTGGNQNPPVLTGPGNISYEEGSVGHTIDWTATDTDPGTYSVTRDGSVIQTGGWVSEIPVLISIDGLTAGSYIYAITMVDLVGNSVSDTVILTVTGGSQGGLKGDVNGDGSVTIVDALMTARYFVGLSVPGFDVSVADVDDSGTVTIVDALMIAQYYVGLISWE